MFALDGVTDRWAPQTELEAVRFAQMCLYPPNVNTLGTHPRCLWTVVTTFWFRNVLTLLVWGLLAPLSVYSQTQGLLREVYRNIGGVNVSDLTNSVSFPAHPDASGNVANFEAPTDVDDNYGQRLSGYIIPPVTGNYTFWIAGDDGCALFLSTDDQPANRRSIASVASWTSSREWTKEPNQKSASIALQADRPYYVEALMKEGGGGDNLAVRWQLPDGGIEEPIPGARLLPFGVTFTAPQIDSEPVDASGVEGGSVVFAVKLKGVSPARFQWFRNDVAISSATNAVYERTLLSLDDHLSSYRCVITNSLGKATTRSAVLSVSPDVTPPSIVDAINVAPDQIRLVFSEPLQPAVANAVENYTVSPGVTLSAATLQSDQKTVVLFCSTLLTGQEYAVGVLDALDRARTPNRIGIGTEIRFTAVDYVTTAIGGAGKPVSNAFAGGLDLGGMAQGVESSSDQFQFGYQLRTGDFDVQVRVAEMDPSNPWAQAGLMVRESLDPSAAFAAVFASPGTVGSYLEYRATLGTPTVTVGSYPVNFPRTWLRLKRVGNRFTGYASQDGITWRILGEPIVVMPGSVYFGLAVAGRSSSSSGLARFREVGPVVSTAESATLPAIEPLGPSNRRTPLVISEIHYHPLSRLDGRNLEFVELFNGGSTPEELTGHRLSGDVSFDFPAGTVLPAGGFLVVAKVPGDIEAVHGIRGVLGPYDGRFSNGGGRLNLRNERGAVLWTTEFGTRQPWPLAADGIGHSLVLTRPSYGEADPRAWAASHERGGSPGRMESIVPRPLAGLVINEVLAHTSVASQEFIELRNNSPRALDVSGCVITDDAAVSRFTIPAGTVIAPSAVMAFGREQLGFGLKSGGEIIVLFAPNGGVALDVVATGAQALGVSSGREPDGWGAFKPLTTPTAGAANSAAVLPSVVINEIFYNPISGDPRDCFVEIFNRSANPVAMGGWRFVDGITFEFPPAALLPGNGFLVVAKDVARLLANHPTLSVSSVLGPYSGSLSKSGERLALARPESVVSTDLAGILSTNTIHVVVDSVSYGSGGQWGRWADGGGSSLERIDPRGDSDAASNWADSDESSKSTFGTIQFTGVLDNGRSDYPADLQLNLQGAGECLVDDVEVVSTAGANLVANPGFESGLNGWTLNGVNRSSFVETGRGVGGSRALHLIATGRGDTGANRIQTILPNKTTLVPGSVATLRARVRWLAGHPEFLMRLRGGWLEAYGLMPLPKNLGTPGARNSRWSPNAGPVVSDVSHAPILPAANESVVVSARIQDPDGVTSVQLRYRVDPGTSLLSVPMNDLGLGGDAVSGDGVFSATIPGLGVGGIVAFQIVSTDGASPGASTRFPALATQECLVRWGESQPLGDLGVYRLWQTEANTGFLNSREPLANDPIDATFVYGNSRVIYNMSMRGKGSPFHGGSIGSDYIFGFPDDDKFLGASDVALVTVGNLGNDSSGQREQAAFWIGRQLGVPYLHRRHVHFFNNGNRQGFVYEDTQEPNGDYADQIFPDASGGDLHKIEDWFEFADDVRTFVNQDATLQKFSTTGGAHKLARYRWDWRKRAIQDSANNFTNLFNLVDAVNSDAASYTGRVENLIDIEEWMRTFALQHMVGNWDAYGYARGKNSYVFKPEGGRWVVMPWDIDFVLGLSSDGVTTDLFGTNDPVIARMYDHPPFRRAFWRAIQLACDGPLTEAMLSPVLNARYDALRRNGVNATAPADILAWVSARRDYLRTRLAEVASAFTAEGAGGTQFTSADPMVTLTGTAPVGVHHLRINGQPVVPTWPGVTQWSLRLGLSPGVNNWVVDGVDGEGRPIPGASANLQITYTGPTLEASRFVVINEIHYHPLEPGSEFVEIHNRSTAASFDLSGCELRGADFVFPPGSIIPPGGYWILAANSVAFSSIYGFGVSPVGQFNGSLDNGGETLRLVRPGTPPAVDEVIDEVRYGDSGAWPTSADGLGPSLQRVDDAQDGTRPANWGATSPTSSLRTTPGAPNSVAGSLTPFPTVWLNEFAPDGGTRARTAAGVAAPWVELHNSGNEPIDLSGLFLSDTVEDLVRWPFPAGTTIPAGGYRMVWLDGLGELSTADECHATFRAAGGVLGSSLFLSRLQNGTPAVLDAISHGYVGSGRSFGSFPDGQRLKRVLMQVPTPGTTNDPSGIPIHVTINEWLASNTTIKDPADGRFDDWFELYNDGAEPVDLSGYSLTDNALDKAQFVIPPATVIPAGGYLLVWADGEPGQTGLGFGLHANFKLSALGETIGLYAPDGSLVDQVTFGAQVPDVSQGRSPDGYGGGFQNFSKPSPGATNPQNTSPGWPTLESVAALRIDEGGLIEFRLHGTSTETPARPLTYTLLGAPAGAQVDAATGAFRWQTTEADGPEIYRFAARVTDNADPVRWATVRVEIRVDEVNQPPALDPVPDRSINEGEVFRLNVLAKDPDLPRNELRFELGTGAPIGARIDSVTGLFEWTPTESQGGAIYPMLVRVTDSSGASAEVSFRLDVKKIENAPVFDPLPTLTVEENVALTVAVHAADPDAANASIRYSLEPGAPAGMGIDPVSGVLSWTPREAQGPASYDVAVTALESGVSGLSSTARFSIIVREVNQPPSVSLPERVELRGGDSIKVAPKAFDPDLPSQRLTFRIKSGAPAGMVIDSVTGLVSWTAPSDAGAASYSVVVEAVDDGFPPLATSASMLVVVRKLEPVRFNEFLLGTGGNSLQFIELLNTGVATRDLSGLRVDPVGFVFPRGQAVAPGGFVVLASDATLFSGRFGAEIPLSGTFTSRLPEAGGVLRLVEPASGDVLDEVAYGRGGAWPDDDISSGASTQLIDPTQENAVPANWGMFKHSGTGVPVPLVEFTGSWKYLQPTEQPLSSWMATDFDDSSWTVGNGLFYVENAALSQPKTTPLTLGLMTYYFRTSFEHAPPLPGTKLRLSLMLDDGAVVYLNGRELFRLGLDAGSVSASTAANRTVADAVVEGVFELDSDLLVAGRNQLAVEVHQVNGSSSDVVFGMKLESLTPRTDISTPGRTNSNQRVLPRFPRVEVARLSRTGTDGVIDSAGDQDPWVEIANRGTEAISLQGLYLAANPNNPAPFALPSDWVLAPGERRLVWCDGEVSETKGLELHTDFRPLMSNEPVSLLWQESGQFRVLSQSHDATWNLALSLGDGQGRKGNEITLPINVGPGFEAVNRLRFQLAYDTAQLMFAGLDAPPSSGWTVIDSGVAGLAFIDWSAVEVEPSRTLEPGVRLVGARFVVRSATGSDAAVMLEPTPSAPSSTTRLGANAAPLVLARTQGMVRIIPLDRLQGNVRYYSNSGAVPGSTLRLISQVGGTTLEAAADASGNFGFELDQPASSTITVLGGPLEAPANGVTTLDILNIRRHVIGLAPLTSPYAILAADVNGSSTVSTLDITLIRRLILGISSELPAGRWKFVPSNHVFPSPSNPWAFPVGRPFEPGSTPLTGQDFIAVRLGDVNGSWVASTPPPPLDGAASSSHLVLGQSYPLPGGVLEVPLAGRGVEGLTSLQFSLGWNPAVLEFVGLGPAGLRGFGDEHLSTAGASSGRLSVSWEDATGAGVTPGEGDALIRLRFRPRPAVAAATVLRFVPSPTPLEVTRHALLVNGVTSNVLVWSGGSPASAQLGVEHSTTGLRLHSPSWFGLRSVLEVTDELSDTSPWTHVAASDGDGRIVTWSISVTGRAQRFYRLRFEDSAVGTASQ